MIRQRLREARPAHTLSLHFVFPAGSWRQHALLNMRRVDSVLGIFQRAIVPLAQTESADAPKHFKEEPC